MAKFCEGCVFRREACGELDELKVTQQEVTAIVRPLRGVEISQNVGRVAIFIDEAGNYSWPFHMSYTGSWDDAANFMSARVAACPGPITKQRGVFTKREEVVGCYGIDGQPIKDPKLFLKLYERFRLDS